MPNRSLGEYIEALIDRLGAREPEAVARIQHIVGTRTAQISLDEASVIIKMSRRNLVVRDPLDNDHADGFGRTDYRTVLALLDGHQELNDVIMNGRLEIIGESTSLLRMLISIEILLDGSSRIPELQELAQEFREQWPLRSRN